MLIKLTLAHGGNAAITDLDGFDDAEALQVIEGRQKLIVGDHSAANEC